MMVVVMFLFYIYFFFGFFGGGVTIGFMAYFRYIYHLLLRLKGIKWGGWGCVSFIGWERAFERGEGIRGIFEGGIFGHVVGLVEGGCTKFVQGVPPFQEYMPSEAMNFSLSTVGTTAWFTLLLGCLLGVDGFDGDGRWVALNFFCEGFLLSRTYLPW